MATGTSRQNSSRTSSHRGSSRAPLESSCQIAPLVLGQPRVVAIGGGHGLSSLLQGLQRHACSLTAIVTVADDGGSSGQLRKDMGILPPGDMRNCIAALAQGDPLVTQLFQYRFGRGTGLDGHAFGNLFIAALAGITGSFESAINEASRLLAARGRVLPSTLENVMLCAEVRSLSEPKEQPELICGQACIAKPGHAIDRVFLQPANAQGYPDAIKALLQADMIVLGPGSLYTSILPNLLVNDIRAALLASSAIRVYVTNVATQPGETDGFSAQEHARVLLDYMGSQGCDYVLANSQTDFELQNTSSALVQPEFDSSPDYHAVTESLLDGQFPWRHCPDKLAAALMRIYTAHEASSSQVACE